MVLLAHASPETFRSVIIRSLSVSFLLVHGNTRYSFFSLDLFYAIVIAAHFTYDYNRACEFSSTSSEISNSRQYKTELNKEVKQSYSTSLSGQGVAKGVPFQLSSSFAFEKSRKFESFREGSIEQSEVSYEAKAICTNFHAQFEPYYAQTLSSAFEVGLASLPVPYDETNDGNRTAYDSFIAAFGTHIVSEVS